MKHTPFQNDSIAELKNDPEAAFERKKIRYTAGYEENKPQAVVEEENQPQCKKFEEKLKQTVNKIFAMMISCISPASRREEFENRLKQTINKIITMISCISPASRLELASNIQSYLGGKTLTHVHPHQNQVRRVEKVKLPIPSSSLATGRAPKAEQPQINLVEHVPHWGKYDPEEMFKNNEDMNFIQIF